MDPPCSNPGRILPYWQEGTARPATNKGPSPRAGVHRAARHNIWCSLRFEFAFITFRRRQAAAGCAATHFSVLARAEFSSGSNKFDPAGVGPEVTNHTKSFAGRGFGADFARRRSPGRRARVTRSLRWRARAAAGRRRSVAPPSAWSIRAGRRCARLRNCSTARSPRYAARSRPGIASH